MTLPTLASTIGDAQRSLDAAQTLAAAEHSALQQAQSQATSYLNQVTGLSAQVTALTAQLTAAGPGKAPAPPPGWAEAFRDDFRGSLGPGWTATTDTAANELSARTPANVLAGPEYLTIRANRQALSGRQFRSGYITTDKRFSMPFGRWLIRARWDDSFGLWPALWLRFDDNPDGTKVVGEIDIMEAVGGARKIVQTAHQNTSGTQDKSGYEWPVPAGWSPSDFHVYGLQRDPDGTLTWTIDNAATRQIKPADLSTKLHRPMPWLAPAGSEYAGAAHLIINQQVGGVMPNYYLNGGQPIDPAKILPGTAPADLRIDWVQALTPTTA